LRIRARPLAKRHEPHFTVTLIQAGFLDAESRRDLIELARDGSVPHRLARRANALVLLDQGMSCGAVAKVLFLDDDTVRTWYRLYQEDGFDGLVSFGYDGSACRLSSTQQDQLKAWITETLPRSTGAVGAWVEAEFGITYESRSGLVALLHRLGEAGPRFRRRSRWNGQTRDGASQAESGVAQAEPRQAGRLYPAIRNLVEPDGR
jgi:transposase